ncbi:hypothetical protein BP6252_05602 [Coleophoma cylindrospora]|uniref:MOSC domain-containing protein n=1 Tax=Coleophoma cylindrospora TaxID=1849047 RepID=A0A3D8RU17_9HELO|nr:hypothetical protein BP6252_05602 [Coleophoma cylindrospora]
MALFGTFLETTPKITGSKGSSLIITFIPPQSDKDPKLEWTGSPDQIRFPVQPDTEKKAVVDVNLHGSPTKAYDMGSDINNWFSERFGYEVMLVHIGKENSRAVFGSLAPSNPEAAHQSLRMRLSAMVSLFVPRFRPEGERLAFNDLGQYLVVTQSSTDEVSSRFASGIAMDVTKFRPNIVLSGPVPAFDEDFWAELTITPSSQHSSTRNPKARNVKMQLTGNCFRCQSITVDYKTGQTAADESGLVWKKLNKDRRVDKGAKWSPVFGRYGFCARSDVGVTLSVGDEVKVTRRNVERTIFDWPGLTTFGLAK